MVKSLFFDYVKPPSQRVFQVGDESAGKERSGVGASLNEEVEVTVGAGLVMNK
jgi:hypothetical protein